MRRKYIILNSNKEKFDTTAFTQADKIKKQSRFEYILINSQLREEIVYDIEITQLGLQDSQYQFSSLTEDDRRIFTSKFARTRPYEYYDNVHIAISWEMNLDMIQLDRTVYSMIDLIGNIGGVIYGLTIFFSYLIGVVNFNKFEHYMIEQLFRIAYHPLPKIKNAYEDFFCT